MRQSKDAYFMEMATHVATRSTCQRRAVGAVLVDASGRVLSTGYNGVVSGAIHCLDAPCAGAGDAPGDTRRCAAVHAEQNVLLQCAEMRAAHTIYVTASPCYVCAKLLCNTRIHRVVVGAPYADPQGLALFKTMGVTVFELWGHQPDARNRPRLKEVHGWMTR